MPKSSSTPKRPAAAKPSASNQPKNVTFFPTPAQFRKWLAKHHASSSTLWVGYYKKDSGRPSITWPESVDEALCFGWIDGLRKSIDEISYTLRFTPRKPRSVWSSINVARAKAMIAEGRMRPAGLAAFESRREPERAALSRLAFHGHFAAHQSRQSPCNRKAEPASPVFAGGGGVRLGEVFKDRGLLFPRDAHARVGNGERD